MNAAAESLPGVPVSRPASAALARYSMSRRIASESGCVEGRRARTDELVPQAASAIAARTTSLLHRAVKSVFAVTSRQTSASSVAVLSTSSRLTISFGECM